MVVGVLLWRRGRLVTLIPLKYASVYGKKKVKQKLCFVCREVYKIRAPPAILEGVSGERDGGSVCARGGASGTGATLQRSYQTPATQCGPICCRLLPLSSSPTRKLVFLIDLVLRPHTTHQFCRVTSDQF